VAFSGEWKPIFSKMMSAPGVEIPHRVEDIFEDILRSNFAKATIYLREIFSYIFQQLDDTVSKYTIGTWPKKIRQSFVKKHGTVEDIAGLPLETNYNQPKKRKDRSEEMSTNPHRKLNKVAVRTSKERLVEHDEASIDEASDASSFFREGLLVGFNLGLS